MAGFTHTAPNPPDPLFKYAEDQPRDDHGRWSASQTQSAHADNMTAQAERSSLQAHSSGKSHLHRLAVNTHRQSARAHRKAAKLAYKEGQHQKAIEHRAKAEEHDTAAADHAGRTIWGKLNRGAEYALGDAAGIGLTLMAVPGLFSQGVRAAGSKSKFKYTNWREQGGRNVNEWIKDFKYGAGAGRQNYGSWTHQPKRSSYSTSGLRHRAYASASPHQQLRLTAGKPTSKSTQFTNPADLHKYAPGQARDDRGRWASAETATTVSRIRTDRAHKVSQIAMRRGSDEAASLAAEAHAKAARSHGWAHEQNQLIGRTQLATEHEVSSNKHLDQQEAFRLSANSYKASARAAAIQRREGKPNQDQIRADNTEAASLHTKASQAHRLAGNSGLADAHQSSAEWHKQDSRPNPIFVGGEYTPDINDYVRGKFSSPAPAPTTKPKRRKPKSPTTHANQPNPTAPTTRPVRGLLSSFISSAPTSTSTNGIVGSRMTAPFSHSHSPSSPSSSLTVRSSSVPGAPRKGSHYRGFPHLNYRNKTRIASGGSKALAS